MLKYKCIKNVALGLILTALGSQGLAAKELRMASGVSPIHPAHKPLYTLFQEQLPQLSDGRLTTSLIGTEVVSLGMMRTGITSGLVNIGLFLPAYFPADLPEINLIGDLAFLGNNPQAMAAAMTEYVVTCDACQAIEPSQELLTATAVFVENDLVFAAREASERYKVKNADAKIEHFRQLVDKWAKIAEAVNNDATKMAEAQQRETWDQVNFSTYGI